MLTDTSVRLRLGPAEFDVELQVPAEAVRLQDMLPVFRSMTDGLVDVAIDASAEEGKPISCKKGCGACCRMAIPVSEPEAYRLTEYVDLMPEPRRTVIKERFASGMEVFRKSGMLGRMFQRPKDDRDAKRAMDELDTYFEKGVPCPFLEEESCSIYEERPLICRQFVVTSDPAYCATKEGKGIERVPLLARPQDALILIASDPDKDRVASMPMIQMFEWVEANPEKGERKTGVEWLDTFANTLQTKACNATGDANLTLDIRQVLSVAFPEGPQELAAMLPQEPVKPQALLPVLQRFTDGMTQIGENAAESRGERVSCTKGCGACCRQVVPVTVPEAYHLRDLVEAMPEPRRSTIRERFASGLAKVEATGAVDGLFNVSGTDRDDIERHALTYYRAQVPCPFLEDEACSIHVDRPLACREFLVTSPASNCDMPTPDNIVRVTMPAAPSRALMVVAPGARAGKMPYVPLIAVLDWTEKNPDELPLKTGGEWMNEFANRLAKMAKAREDKR